MAIKFTVRQDRVLNQQAFVPEGTINAAAIWVKEAFGEPIIKRKHKNRPELWTWQVRFELAGKRSKMVMLEMPSGTTRLARPVALSSWGVAGDRSVPTMVLEAIYGELKQVNTPGEADDIASNLEKLWQLAPRMRRVKEPGKKP